MKSNRWSAAIRAFSEFSSEPPVRPEQLDLHSIVEERISFLKAAHPEKSVMPWKWPHEHA